MEVTRFEDLVTAPGDAEVCLLLPPAGDATESEPFGVQLRRIEQLARTLEMLVGIASPLPRVRSAWRSQRLHVLVSAPARAVPAWLDSVRGLAAVFDSVRHLWQLQASLDVRSPLHPVARAIDDDIGAHVGAALPQLAQRLLARCPPEVEPRLREQLGVHLRLRLHALAMLVNAGAEVEVGVARRDGGRELTALRGRAADDDRQQESRTAVQGARLVLLQEAGEA